MNPSPDSKANPNKYFYNRIKGILCVLTAWIFFTLAIAISKPASENSSVPTVLFFQNFISLLIIIPWMIKKGRKSLYLTKYPVIILRSIAGYLGFAFIFLAVQRTSLVNAVLLRNSAPLFLPLIIWYWRKVKISRTIWVGMLIGLVGIAIILKPTHHIINLGALFALGSALCSAISMIAQRRLAKRESTLTVLFYYFLLSTVLSVPFTLESWRPLNPELLQLLLGVGICFAIGQILFLQAFKYARPSFLGSFNYSAVVYGVLIEWIFWDHFPDWTCILGILVVCAGGLITLSQGTKLPMKTRKR